MNLNINMKKIISLVSAICVFLIGIAICIHTYAGIQL